MTSEPTAIPVQDLPRSQPLSSLSSQYGSLSHGPHDLCRVRSGGSSSSSQTSALNTRRDSTEPVDADRLDKKLRRLSRRDGNYAQPLAPGQRISEYENALTPPTPRQGPGFKVIKRFQPCPDGMHIFDFPNG